MKTVKNIFLLLTCFILLVACSDKSKYDKKIMDFSFKNEDGQSFGTDQLLGTIWIADFIFTKCTSVCQPMTAEMAALQEKLKNENIEVNFVSFTVDPATDSPELLKTYLEEFTDDLSNWHMLTGYSQNEIEVFARDQFQTIVQKPTSSNQVIHGTNFYLIDQQGVLVNEYNYIDATYVDDMMKEIKKLTK